MNKLTEFFGIALNLDCFSTTDSQNFSHFDELIANKRIDCLLNEGIERGFPDEQIRFKAYELIMCIQDYTISENLENKDIVKDIYVIENDVHRSLNVNSASKFKTWTQKVYFKTILKETILKFFIKNKTYSYFQGFNSIAERFITSYRPENSFCALEKLSKLFFKDVLMEEYFCASIVKSNKIIKNICLSEKGLLINDGLFEKASPFTFESEINFFFA